MRYASLPSGIECATAAVHPLGWKPVFFAEIARAACKFLSHTYPHVPNLGDMNKIFQNETYQQSTFDVLIGGTPCFSSDTLVMTSKGFVKISDIKKGDLVLTHRNRWRPVLRTGSKLSPTVSIKGQGAEITTTANHEFFDRRTSKIWDNEKRKYVLEQQPYEWIPAEKMNGKRWCAPISYEYLKVPEIIKEGREKCNISLTDQVAYIIGRWLGDGWCRINDRRGYIMICCSLKDSLDEYLQAAGLHFSMTLERTTKRYQIADKAFAKWLIMNFGEKAHGKYLAAWVFSMSPSLRQHLFSGYIDADGTRTKNGYKSTSVSAKLSYSMGLLSATLGMSYSIYRSLNKRECLIEGRKVTESPNYVVSYYNNSRSSFFGNGFFHGLVRSVKKTGKIEKVYDLEVKEDHSYTANGIAVHNCQSFSIAGLREGLDSENGNLTLTWCRILCEKQPPWFVWENVPGVFSSFTGGPGKVAHPRKVRYRRWKARHITETSDFAAILNAFQECGYSVAWRVLDAQYFGVPQHRRRLFVVGYRGIDWRPPAAVLFERESLRRDFTPRRKKGQETAGTLDARVKGGGFPGTDGATNRHIIAALTKSGVGVTGADDNQAQAGHLIAATIDANYGRLQGASGQDLNHGHSTLVTQELKVFGGNNCGGDIPVSAPLNAKKGARMDFATESLGVYNITQITSPQNGSNPTPGDPVPTLPKNGHPSVLIGKQIVRRLMPLECERLMGLPDGYTNVAGLSDSARYSLIGNGMAVPVITWIAQRIDLVQEILNTLPKTTP